MAKIIFNMPEGDEEFDELQDGEKMKVTCTIKKEKGMKACLVAVGGKTLDGYSDDSEADETENDDEQSEGESDDSGDFMGGLDNEMPNS